MISDKTIRCSECHKLCGRRSGKRHGFILCGRCIKKNCLPNIFKQTHPKFEEWELKHKLKRTKGYRNLKDYEKRFLWIKHIKSGESAAEATAAVKGIVEMVKKFLVLILYSFYVLGFLKSIKLILLHFLLF